MSAEVEIPSDTLDENGKATVDFGYGITLNVSREFVNGNVVTFYRYCKKNVAAPTFDKNEKTYFYVASKKGKMPFPDSKKYERS